MAHIYSNGNFSQPHDQQYHPLDDISSTYIGSTSPMPSVPYASQDADYNSTAYLGYDITDHHGDGSVPPGLAPVAQYPPGSPIQELQAPEIVSDAPGKSAQFSLQDWQWEFGAFIFSMGCFAAVVGVLASYNTRSLASWNFVFGITLNTLVAILSTLSRTALLVPVASCISQLKWIHLVTAPRSLRDVQVFDDASRGPWGSLELIWRLHIGAKLATWGSVITILTLAMGPFTQQLLSYPSRSIISGNATYYTSHIYDSAWGESRSLRAGTGLISESPEASLEDCILI
jgi:hypothetical protein